MGKERTTLSRFWRIPKIVEETKDLYARPDRTDYRDDLLAAGILADIEILRELATPVPTKEEVTELKALRDELAGKENLTPMDYAMEQLSWYCDGSSYRVDLVLYGLTVAENFRNVCLEEYRRASGIYDILIPDLTPIRPIRQPSIWDFEAKFDCHI